MIESFFARSRRHILAEWWWTIDRRIFMILGALMLIGMVMSFAASPSVALRIELSAYHFLQKQIVFMVAGILIIVLVSLLPPSRIFQLGWALLVVGLLAMASTLFFGPTIKGATRWLYIAGISVQPSEFMKPGIALVLAVLFARSGARYRNLLIGIGLGVLTAMILISQPDIGQLVLVSLLWGYLYYISGGRILILGGLVLVALVGAVVLYISLDHFASRINNFMDPRLGDNYQVRRGIEAIQNGGALGVGLGDGEVKAHIPDAHADYVFAVAVEEGGFVFGGVIITLFGFLAFHVLGRCAYERDHRIQLASAGLVALIVTQAAINLAVNLDLVPAKGMTLPFISYGGSSLLAVAVTMGMLLGLTRRRVRDHSVGDTGSKTGAVAWL